MLAFVRGRFVNACAPGDEARSSHVQGEASAIRALIETVKKEEVISSLVLLYILFDHQPLLLIRSKCMCLCSKEYRRLPWLVRHTGSTPIHSCVCTVLLQVAGFPVEHLPPQEATNRIAAAVVKAKKQIGTSAEGSRPFPFMDVGDFLPDWAGVRRTSFRDSSFCKHCSI